MNATLAGTDLMVWQTIARTSLPRDAAYFWTQVRNEAIRRIGDVAYRGKVWEANVDATAESILDQLGVEHEIYAGQRYIAGFRVYWNSTKGRYEQDTFR